MHCDKICICDKNYFNMKFCIVFLKKQIDVEMGQNGLINENVKLI